MLGIGSKITIPLKVNITHDHIFKFTTTLSSSTTIKDLKTLIVQRLGIYSINYLIEYNDKDFTKHESFTLGEIFITIDKDKEYKINLKDIETYVRERQSQRVMISYEEGGNSFYIYNLINMKFEKITPEKGKAVKFDKFPFNSRYVHLKKENRIVITGGIDFETGCCSYDYDSNYIADHPNGKNERLMHSMVNIGDSVFLIGGLYSKAVDSFNIDFEDWINYPDMNYDRKDPSVCIVNSRYLYVFMGYSQAVSGVAQNFERLDISLDAYTTQWNLLPVNNPLDLPAIRTHIGILPYENGFLLLGGYLNYKCDRNVNYFDYEDYSIKRSKFNLPFETSFVEKEMFTIDDNYFYLFTYGSVRLIRFDKLKSNIQEVIL